MSRSARAPGVGRALVLAAGKSTRLRPLAAESLMTVFALSMDDAAERAFGRQLERLPDSKR